MYTVALLMTSLQNYTALNNHFPTIIFKTSEPDTNALLVNTG